MEPKEAMRKLVEQTGLSRFVSPDRAAAILEEAAGEAITTASKVAPTSKTDKSEKELVRALMRDTMAVIIPSPSVQVAMRLAHAMTDEDQEAGSEIALIFAVWAAEQLKFARAMHGFAKALGEAGLSVLALSVATVVKKLGDEVQARLLRGEGVLGAFAEGLDA